MIYYFVWEHLLFHSGGKYKSLTAKKLGESTIVKFRNRLNNVKYLGGYEDKKGGSNIRLEMNNEALFLKFDSANKIIPIRDLKNFKIMTESQIQKDISVGRILILGVFALATNKTKTVTDNYLLLKYNDHGEDRDIILQHDKVEELYNNIKQLKHENDVLVERNII